MQKGNMIVSHEMWFWEPVRSLTSCATKKAKTNKNPGRSINDQLRDRVTKMRAWLMVLTWRYTAEASFWKSSWAVFSRLSTPNTLCRLETMTRVITTPIGMYNKLLKTLRCLWNYWSIPGRS
jgi:hypothetical protein